MWIQFHSLHRWYWYTGTVCSDGIGILVQCHIWWMCNNSLAVTDCDIVLYVLYPQGDPIAQYGTLSFFLGDGHGWNSSSTSHFTSDIL